MSPLAAEIDRLRAELAASKLAFVQLGRKLDATVELLREVLAAEVWHGAMEAEGTVMEELQIALRLRVKDALKEG